MPTSESCKHGIPHWGRVTYICVSRPTAIGSDIYLSSGRRRTIIYSNAGTLGNKIKWNRDQNVYMFIQENTCDNVVCLMAAILSWSQYDTYRKVSNIRRTLVGNKIVDHSDVVGASPVGAAPTTSSFST